jgi:hypothetical protein
VTEVESPPTTLTETGRLIRERAAKLQRTRENDRQERQIAAEERDRTDRQKYLCMRLRQWGIPDEEACDGWLPLGDGWWLQAAVDYQHGLALYGDCPHCGAERVLFGHQLQDVTELAGFPDAITEPLYDHGNGRCLLPRDEDGEILPHDHPSLYDDPPPTPTPRDRIADALEQIAAQLKDGLTVVALPYQS